jgi:molybdenum-dependent DNA-binding transcriptional regulator ModE
MAGMRVIAPWRCHLIFKTSTSESEFHQGRLPVCSMPYHCAIEKKLAEPDTMNLRTLRYFVAIADAGSLTAAAATLSIAQPALTRQLRDLEADLGQQLLQRMPRGVRLTPAGVTFYESAQRILTEAARVRQKLARRKENVAATVVLGASPTASRA